MEPYTHVTVLISVLSIYVGIMPSVEELSRRLYRQLDCTGYSNKMISIRRKAYQMLGDIYRDRYDNMAVYSGSQGEGISKIGESDTDILYLLSGYMCVTNQKVWQRVPSLGTVFTIANTYSGYCNLELARHEGSCHHAIETSLVIKNGSHFLSSSKFKAAEIGTHTPKEPALTEMTGPALTVTDVCGVMFDFVYTISCECQQILQTWASRRRKYDWPPLSLRQVIPNMNGNIVATGMQNSETDDLESRYCFNEIELLIFGILNDTQVTLYNMLNVLPKTY